MTRTKQEQERRNFVHTVEVLMASALAERDLARTTGRAFTKKHRMTRVALAVAGSAIVIMLCFYAAVQLSLVNWGTVESVAKNEPILANKITGAGQRGTLSSVIEPDMKAITIRVDDVLGVAGFVQPDDRVDVLLTRNDRPTASPYPDVLLQNARVLAIDQIADRIGQVKPAKAVTIEVTTDDAQKVALGSVVGQLSLRQAGSLDIGEARRIGPDDLSKLRREVEAVKPASPDTPIVTVTRGARERSLYELTPTGRREVRAEHIGRRLHQSSRDATRSAAERPGQPVQSQQTRPH